MSTTIGCEHSVETTYIIENASDHSINLRFYAREYDVETRTIVVKATMTKKIDLEANGDYWFEVYKEDMTTDSSIMLLLDADSAIVTFNDQRILYFTVGEIVAETYYLIVLTVQ